MKYEYTTNTRVGKKRTKAAIRAMTDHDDVIPTIMEIMNVMASPTLCPSTNAAVRQHQRTHTYKQPDIFSNDDSAPEADKRSKRLVTDISNVALLP